MGFRSIPPPPPQSYVLPAQFPMYLGCGIFELSPIFTRFQPFSPILHPLLIPSFGTMRRQRSCSHIDLSPPWGLQEGRGYVFPQRNFI